MLKNAYLLAKIGADTAENERNFDKNWQLTTLRVHRRSAPSRSKGLVPVVAETLVAGLEHEAGPRTAPRLPAPRSSFSKLRFGSGEGFLFLQPTLCLKYIFRTSSLLHFNGSS